MTIEAEVVEPEEPKKTLFEQVNDRLNSARREDQDEITIQDIASHLGVGLNDLYEWGANNEEFRKGLERYKELDATGLFNDKEFGNRADAIVLGMLILETKKKDKP